jgi:hypothetical protein
MRKRGFCRASLGSKEGILEETVMSGTDEVEDIRLPGRVPRSGTRPRHTSPDVDSLAGDDEDIETVNRLLGFLRAGDEP